MVLSSTTTFSPVAVINEYGNIVEVNRAWEAFGDRNGLPDEYTSVGKNYVAISQQAEDRYGYHIAAELQLLLTDEKSGFTAVYPCHSPNQKRWFRLYATAVSLDDNLYYLLVHQRLDRDPPSRRKVPSKVVDTLTKNDDHRDHSRLVTYSLAPNESATEGIVMAFDAIGIDLQHRGTTLKDYMDPDVINALQTGSYCRVE